MENRVIDRKKIKFQLEYRYFNNEPKWKDIKDIQFQDSDIIFIGYDEGLVSENESYDAHWFCSVERFRDETDEEMRKRIHEAEKFTERMKKKRYENYLKLKEEFENK